MLQSNVLHVLVHQTIIVHRNYKSLKTQIRLQHAVFLLVRLCIKTIKMCQTRHIFIVLIHNLTSKIKLHVLILMNMLSEIKSILYVLFMLFFSSCIIFISVLTSSISDGS
jgi:hypothetical protein